MDERFKSLLDLAFERGPAIEANRLIGQVRAEQERSGKAVSYEIVASEDATFDWFAEKVLPRLVYHLECIGARLPACAGVFLSIFVGERLYFLHARDVLARAGECLGLSPQELAEQHGTGESHAPVQVDEQTQAQPLRLPGPKAD